MIIINNNHDYYYLHVRAWEAQLHAWVIVVLGQDKELDFALGPTNGLISRKWVPAIKEVALLTFHPGGSKYAPNHFML